MKEEIQKIIEKALLELKNQEDWSDFQMPEINVDYPKDEIFGDYTSNISMVMAGVIGESPLKIARKLSEKIKADFIGEVQIAAPGYINIFLSKKYFQNIITDINRQKNDFGSRETTGKKIMVEYSQPNTNKEFHVGHLRNVIIGSTLVNVLRKSGNKVIAANYIGDTGTHIAKSLWGIKKFHEEVDWNSLDNKTEFLGQVYSEAVQKIGENKGYEEEFRDIQRKLEEGDRDLTEIWKRTRQYSLDEFKSIYKKLGVNFDVYFYESEEEKEGKKMLPELLKTGIARESEGAVIADLEKYDLGVLVLVRSDGAALYGIKDIPLAIKKFKKYDIDASIYVVDIRQGLYFKQLFKILEEMGFKEKMDHIGYDFVSLKGGESMSSRKGNVVTARSLMETVTEKIKNKFPESPKPDGISLGALKFFMLKYSPSTKIEFDIEESVKLEGATGPYVQYAHARISSILRKAKGLKFKFDEADLSLLSHEKEVSLMRELYRFPELLEEISCTYEAHKLPFYAMKLADKFHSFYSVCKVLDEKDSSLTRARLNLVNAVRIVLRETLDLMGIDSPEKM